MSQRSRAGNPSIRGPASRELTSDSVELYETEVCFLHIQLTGTTVPLPKIHKTPPEFDFESSRSPAKSASWNRPSLQCCAVSPLVVCVAISWNQSCQSSVTCLAPFCDWSCKLVHGPQDVRSSNSCQRQAFQDKLWANFWQFSNCFELFFLELMIIQAMIWNFVKLLHFSYFPIHSIAQRVFEHVPPCHRTTQQFAREGFPTLVTCQLLK